MKKNFSIIITISSLLFFKLAAASNLPLDIFPINNYPQSIEFWFNENNDKIYSNDQLYPLKKDSLLVTKTMQAAHYNHLIQNYYGTNLRDSSPWAMPYIVNIVKKYNLALIELRAIQNFTNDPDKSENQQTYAINYIPYTTNWSEEILKNMNLESFMLHKFIYKLQNRAITTTNIALRIVPTDAPVFLNYQIAGEGYPFDNNQASKVDIATPVYVVTTSKDGVWSLIITPYTWGWAPTRSVAYVNNNFIHKWQESIKKYGLLAIIKSNTPILLRTQNILGLKKTSTTKKPAKISYQKQFVYDTAFISAIFPNAKPSSIYSEHMRNSNNNYILIPTKNYKTNMAEITVAEISKNNSVIMPYELTLWHILAMLKNLQGRPYSWGGTLNYNDCSAEIQSIFIPFGFYVPRNSSQQQNIGRVVDLSSLNALDRQKYLLEYGVPFLTLVYIKSHVMLYVGNTDYFKYTDDENKEHDLLVPLTYQNIWGMSNIKHDYRFVIGKAVFFPLLLNYDDIENEVLASELDSSIFKLIYLN